MVQWSPTGSVDMLRAVLPVQRLRRVPDHPGAPQIALGPGRLFARHAVQAIVAARLVGHQIPKKQHHVRLGDDAARIRFLPALATSAAQLHVRRAPNEALQHQHEHHVRQVQAEHLQGANRRKYRKLYNYTSCAAGAHHSVFVWGGCECLRMCVRVNVWMCLCVVWVCVCVWVGVCKVHSAFDERDVDGNCSHAIAQTLSTARNSVRYNQSPYPKIDVG